MIYFQTFLLLLIITIILRKNSFTKTSNSNGKKLILDTCALIDGRILELVRTGFIIQTLIIPKFIIHELQMLADGSDNIKRSRGRFGLDIVRELQDSRMCRVIIHDDEIANIALIDDKLVALAKKLNAELYTTDFNLNKVAEIQGVRVLNINELSQSLRPAVLPGERQKVKIIQKGSSPKQGVGYLEDGTMVVVENAASSMSKTLDVEISRIHQTVSGKMLFAEKIK